MVGIAVEARNLDVLREAVTRASKASEDSTKAAGTPGKDELMDYLLEICMNVVQERILRDEILRLILDMLASTSVASPDYFSIAKCIVYLDQHAMASDLLKRLVEQGDAKSMTTAYQTSFDLSDNGSQDFLAKVMEGLPQTQEEESEFPTTNGHATQPNHAEDAQESDQLLSGPQDSTTGEANVSTIPTRAKPSALSDEQKQAYASINDILTGTKSLELNLEFLLRANQSDRHVMTKLKNSLEARNSVFHVATTLSNGFAHSGTTRDWFIRENLDWLQKATNWSKFAVTASLGVIHRGNIGQGQKLMAPYLKDSSYSKGGALFGMGLIYANHGKHVSDYLFDELKKASTDETIQHGAALGLGVATMASGADHIVDELKKALWQESAISGQAAGLGMGLVLLGTGRYAALKDMLQYAQDTEHDKTIRGLAIGMALIMYAQQEAADVLINGLLDDPDPTIRYGGIMTIALAYCGTSSNKAVRRLLHVAVSDVNDDVRRMAVMSLGFVLFRKPNAVPRMVELLAESYNPHVRYGAAMALGIACAGTGLEEAVDLLEPMMKDSSDFVRQGTMIALSMIMVQQTEAMNPKVTTIRKQFLKTVGDRHEEAITKFGAALALGIIDAGGRNCTISLQTQTGNLNMSAIVGMAVFTQYWYWFPFGHFLTLAFTPTTIIAVDQDLELPQIPLHCNARQSMFDYPPSMEVKAEEAPEKVKTAVLSTTAQAKRRKIAKDKQTKGDSMDVDATSPGTPKANAADDKMDVDEDADKDNDDKAAPEDVKDEQQAEDGSTTSATATATSTKRKAEKEKIGFDIENISRVLPRQLRYTSFPESGRYVPIKKPTGGVILMTDTTPSEPKSLIERQVPKKAAPVPATNTASTPAQQTSGSFRMPSPPGDLMDANNNDDVAAILNAVDEDEEGGVEADVPGEFEYESDGEGGGSDE